MGDDLKISAYPTLYRPWSVFNKKLDPRIKICPYQFDVNPNAIVIIPAIEVAELKKFLPMIEEGLHFAEGKAKKFNILLKFREIHIVASEDTNNVYLIGYKLEEIRVIVGDPKRYSVFFNAMKGIFAHELGHSIYMHGRNGESIYYLNPNKKINEIDFAEAQLNNWKIRRYHLSEIDVGMLPEELKNVSFFNDLKEMIADKIMLELAGNEEAEKVVRFKIVEFSWHDDPESLLINLVLAKYLKLDKEVSKLYGSLASNGKPWNNRKYVDKLINSLMGIFEKIKLTP